MKFAIGTSLFALTLGLYLLMAPAEAATISFMADLKGPNVVPPRNQGGTGSLMATLDTANNTLTWHGSYSGLRGKRISIFFRGPAAPNENADIIFPIQSVSGGSAKLSDEQVRDLIAGYWYVVIQTRTPPRMEIRGQVVRGR